MHCSEWLRGVRVGVAHDAASVIRDGAAPLFPRSLLSLFLSLAGVCSCAPWLRLGIILRDVFGVMVRVVFVDGVVALRSVGVAIVHQRVAPETTLEAAAKKRSVSNRL